MKEFLDLPGSQAANALPHSGIKSLLMTNIASEREGQHVLQSQGIMIHFTPAT